MSCRWRCAEVRGSRGSEPSAVASGVVHCDVSPLLSTSTSSPVGLQASRGRRWCLATTSCWWQRLMQWARCATTRLTVGVGRLLSSWLLRPVHCETAVWGRREEGRLALIGAQVHMVSS